MFILAGRIGQGRALREHVVRIGGDVRASSMAFGPFSC
jgi:hypothetical protein